MTAHRCPSCGRIWYDSDGGCDCDGNRNYKEDRADALMMLAELREEKQTTGINMRIPGKNAEGIG